MPTFLENMGETQRLLLVGLVGLLLGIVLTSLWFVARSGGEPAAVEEDGVGETAATEAAASADRGTEQPRETLLEPSGRIEVGDQAAGSAVQITRVTLESDGWVAVHETLDGAVGNVLGAARFEQGVSEGEGVKLLRATSPGQTYIVRLYSDNGNRTFELDFDPLVVGAEGEPIEGVFQTL